MRVKKHNEFIKEILVKESIDEMLYEGWLNNMLKTLGAGAKAVLNNFTKPFADELASIKNDWSINITADEIKASLKDTFTQSFKQSLASLKNIKEEEEIYQIINNLLSATDKLKANMINMVNQSLNESKTDEISNAVKKLFATVSDSFKTSATVFVDAIKKQKDLNAKIDEAKKRLTEIFKATLKRIDATDIKSLIKGGEIKTDSDVAYKPGDKIKYTKKDGSTNIATVNPDQSTALDNLHVVLISDKKTVFQIEKTKIIEIVEQPTK